MSAGAPRAPRRPRFFLSEGSLDLESSEMEHAVSVLRMRAGDLLEGLDGKGGRIPLRVVSANRGRLVVEPEGPARSEPAPGEPRSALPRIELAVAWPRRARAEAMIGQLVQLGVAALIPLAAEQRGAEPIPKRPSPRWSRIAREACKQSGRAWLPELAGPCSPGEIAAARSAGAIALLDPRGRVPLASWLRSLPLVVEGVEGPGGPGRPIVLVVGPEGGFTGAEREGLLEAGAKAVTIAPHVLRVETAAVAAMAVAAALLMR